jgi:predicted  nucleic acid-binding Zn-ribbon protein
MRVRCSHCGAEYEAAVTLAGLGWVGRCEQCGRSGLQAVENDEPAVRPAREAPQPVRPRDADS